jgi:hypothetical protein
MSDQREIDKNQGIGGSEPLPCGAGTPESVDDPLISAQ